MANLLWMPLTPTLSPKGRGGQSGQAIVLIALALTVLIGMVAIAIDGSRAYAVRRDLQASIDAAALAAADKMQQTGSYVTAEQTATTVFSMNMRLYNSPACSGYGTPGAAPWTVTCTYSDGTVLTNVARALGPQGSRFQLTATRTLPLQFGRVLTNGTNPTLGAIAHGNVNNLLYSPTVAALDPGGCGGVAGSGITVNGTGTLRVTGDMVANGSVNVAAGAVSVSGDIYSRCQSPVSGATNACYPSGASTPCTFPDVAGATRSGNRLPDPGYPGPTALGGSQGLPSNNVVVSPGIYASQPVLNSDRCWFLAGGVYTFPAGATNLGDFVSNELKPPDEADASLPNVRATNQFWNTAGVNCAGSFQLTKQTGPRDLPFGNWGFVVTSVRTDTYAGVSYTRESAPSMCRQINLNNHFDDVRIDISNVPGATSYNVYASPAPNACGGPFGLASNVPITDPVQNDNTNPCPIFTGSGCSLGNESKLLSSDLDSPFAPNAGAAAGTIGSYPPDRQTAPIGFGLPNQNPGRGAAASGDRANENNCKSLTNTYISCPGPITPGAVLLNFPAGGCLTTGVLGDTYVFSGYQYNWMSFYSAPGNTCTHTLGAAGNSAWVGLVYAPGATISVTSAGSFQSPGMGGVIADNVRFAGSLPAITFSAIYAPIPPAARITS